MKAKEVPLSYCDGSGLWLKATGRPQLLDAPNFDYERVNPSSRK
jgi:hypothetical protein